MEKMEQEITVQKEHGVTDIKVDAETFKSKYWEYGDWGNSGVDVSKWPNTSYAKFYVVDTFRVN